MFLNEKRLYLFNQIKEEVVQKKKRYKIAYLDVYQTKNYRVLEKKNPLSLLS